MEEKNFNKSKLIITSSGVLAIVAGLLTLTIPLFNTPNYRIYYSNNTYNYNSSGLGLDSSDKQISIAYSDKVLKDNSNKNGYLIDLDYLKNDNSKFTLTEEYVDVIFETTFEKASIKKAANFELKSSDKVIYNYSISSSGTYSIRKVDIKSLSTLEIYEKEPLTVLKDEKDSTLSYSKLNVKVIYFGR